MYRQIVHFFALSPNRYRRVSREKHLSPPTPQFFLCKKRRHGRNVRSFNNTMEIKHLIF